MSLSILPVSGPRARGMVPMPGGAGEWTVGDRDVVVDPDRRLLMRRESAKR